MRHRLIVFICAAVITTLLAAADATTFDPGCSFYGGQCVYSIKLGHQNHCDNSPTSSTSSSVAGGGECCKELSAKYTALSDDLDILKTKVEVLTSSMTSGNKDSKEIEKALKKALSERNDIVAQLNRKEAELSSTKAELAKVMAKAAGEIKSLRESNSICQTALTGTPSPSVAIPTTDHQNGNYNLTYIGFNEPQNIFKISQRSSSLKITLMHSDFSYGPKNDHTWGIRKGSYIGVGTVAKRLTDAGVSLIEVDSVTFPPAPGYCIMFYYYMQGSGVNTLTTNIKISGQGGYPVFSHNGPTKTKEWNLAVIDLTNEYTKHQFKINLAMMTSKAYAYYHYVGSIAVDDMYIYSTPCSNVPKYPSGAFKHYVDNVTSFYTFHSTPMTWTDAYDECRRQGPWSALVSIQSASEWDFLLKTIRNDPALNMIGSNGFYTSGTDADNEHTFTWTNTGVGQSLRTTRWHHGQPNNVAGNQDCLLLEYPNDNYEWGDVDCDSKHPFICEVELSGKI